MIKYAPRLLILCQSWGVLFWLLRYASEMLPPLTRLTIFSNFAISPAGGRPFRSLKPWDPLFMAIISSTAIGSGQKSAGVLTYRRSRGRTIASQRVVTNKSNTAAQALQRKMFRQASHIMSVLAFVINRSTEKSKFGSSRNNFFKSNSVAFFEPGDDVLGVIASQTTPYAMVKKMIETLNGEPLLWCIGSGNGLVTPASAGDSNGATSSVTIRAYNATKAECTAETISINADGTIVIADTTSQIVDDAGGASCSLTVQADGTASAVNYKVVIMKTTQGIITSKYIVATATSGDDGDGSPGEI